MIAIGIFCWFCHVFINMEENLTCRYDKTAWNASCLFHHQRNGMKLSPDLNCRTTIKTI
jgi:hypothetical protein